MGAGNVAVDGIMEGHVMEDTVGKLGMSQSQDCEPPTPPLPRQPSTNSFFQQQQQGGTPVVVQQQQQQQQLQQQQSMPHSHHHNPQSMVHPHIGPGGLIHSNTIPPHHHHHHHHNYQSQQPPPPPQYNTTSQHHNVMHHNMTHPHYQTSQVSQYGESPGHTQGKLMMNNNKSATTPRSPHAVRPPR